VGERIGIEDFGPCHTMGIVQGGVIKVGLVWCEYKQLTQSISMCLAVEDPACITPGIMRQVFGYAFDELGVRRITNSCSIDNRKAMAINLRAGFVMEGVLRQAYPDGSDMAIFGMLRGECRYLNKRNA
jgi:hypothetical protein